MDVSWHRDVTWILLWSRTAKYIILIILIYIYAFSRRFYPKWLTVHSGYTCIVSMCFLGIEPTTFCAANTMLNHWATGTLINIIYIILGNINIIFKTIVLQNVIALYCDYFNCLLSLNNIIILVVVVVVYIFVLFNNNVLIFWNYILLLL